jgi:hypothetical protein
VVTCCLVQFSTACIDYGAYIHWAGNINVSGTAYRVEVVGTHAYVSSRSSSSSGKLTIVSLADPTSPSTVGSVTTSDTPYGAAVVDTLVFVAVVDDGLDVIDISNPASPVVIATLPTPGRSFDVAVSGNYAYIADFAGGLQIADISDPTLPVLVGGVATPGNAYAVTVQGSYTYVADREGGLQVVDVSNPASPVIVQTVPIDNAYGVDLKDDYAFVADHGTDDLIIVDISNPPSAVVVGSAGIPWTNLCADVRIEGDIAYVTAAGPVAVDISNPLAPEVLSHIRVGANTYSIGVAEGVVCVTTPDIDIDLQVIDASTPSAPAEVGWIEGNYTKLALAGDYAYVCKSSTLSVVDISTPSAPTIVGTAPTSGGQDIALSGNHAYVACGLYGLFIFDVTVPSAPFEIGNMALSDRGFGVALQGNYAYVAIDNGGLEVCNVSNPTSPYQVGLVDTPGNANEVAVQGAYAYVADGYGSGLQVISITDPTTPVIVGSVLVPGTVYGVKVSGEYAYVTSYSLFDGLHVIDISSPTAPTIVSNIQTYGTGPRYAAVVDTLVYITSTHSGFHVISVADVNAPRYIGEYNSQGNAVDIALTDSHAFLADTQGGFCVLPAQCRTLTAAPSTATPVRIVELANPHPNPFNPSVEIAFSLWEAGPVSLNIFDVRGRRLRRLLDGAVHAAGQYWYNWDGKDDLGRELPSGVYFCRIEALGTDATKKMTLLK